MNKILSILSLLVLVISCSEISLQPLNPSVYYRNDICVTYETGVVKEEKVKNFFKRFKNGKYRNTTLVRETATFCGVGVLPEIDTYRIQVEGFGGLDYFALSTCHEETTSENPDSGWFKDNGKTSFDYSPTIEKGKACPLYISAYNKQQRHSWGVLLFENERYKLPARLNCNGMIEEFEGVSICQSRQSLIQQIHFNEPVKLLKPVNGAAERKGDCPIIGKDGDTSIEFQLPNRECYYGFIGMNSKQIHQLLTIGYEDIIIRE